MQIPVRPFSNSTAHHQNMTNYTSSGRLMCSEVIKKNWHVREAVPAQLKCRLSLRLINRHRVYDLGQLLV